MCQLGQAVVQQLFETFDDKNLRGLITWLPMLEGDDAEAASRQSELFRESRVSKGWDAQRRIGDLFAQTLGLQSTAWDVYLLYPPGVRWDDAKPPQPAFWMHQLPEVMGADSKLFLDADRLAEELRRLLEAPEGYARD